jgi:hypothetical protein
MKELYLAICEVLKAEVTELQWIDLWANQFNEGDSYLLFLPAVFVNISMNFQNQNLMGRSQKADTAITLHLAQNLFLDRHEGSPDQERSLETLDLIEKIADTLQGFAGEVFSPIVRESLKEVESRGGVLIYELGFRTVSYTEKRAFESIAKPTLTINR